MSEVGNAGVFAKGDRIAKSNLNESSIKGHDNSMMTPPTKIPTPSPAAMPFDRHGRRIDPEASLQSLHSFDALARLRWAVDTFGDRLAVTTSFGIQSAVLLHMISELNGSGLASPVPVIWVDTGYLPSETYRYADQVCRILSLTIHVAQAEISPARMEALHGRLWETGKAKDLEYYNRIRKVDPLDKAFRDLKVSCWASGVRGGQTEYRHQMQVLENVRGLWSLRPLLSWTLKDIYYYMEAHGLPQHPLFEQGYSTVGDWHSSGPDNSEVRGRATRFGGLSQECGIHLPGFIGEGI